MKKKNKYENKNIIPQKDSKNIKKSIIHPKISSNQPFLIENKIYPSKMIYLDSNYSSIQNNNNVKNIHSKLNLNLHPIKKTRSKKENEINGFSLFLKGDSNFITTKNEVNLITTQYSYGNNQLLIHKFSKDFSSNKIKSSLNNNNNNMINNNNIIDNEDKLKTQLNLGNVGQRKKSIVLNDLKNKKKIITELKNIKEIRETIYENQNQIKQENNNNINNNNNIVNKKLPGLLMKKNNINLIDYFKIPSRAKLISPLLHDKSNFIRKKSEITLHKIRREKEKEKEFNEKEKEKQLNEKDKTFGNKIHWKKIMLIKEGENCYIYKSFNISNGQVFIVKEYKVINNKDKEKGKIAKKLFYHEAKHLKTIRHKNIVEFIDAEVVNNNNNNTIFYYIYLNYIGGYTLNEFYNKIGFFTKLLLKKFIEQLIIFMDYMKLKGLFYNNLAFNHIMFDLDGNIRILDFSKVMTQHDMIRYSYIRHNEDKDFICFKNMILDIIFYEKSKNLNNQEILNNDIINFCTFLESAFSNTNCLSEFKNNYFFKEHKDKEESIFFKNSFNYPSLD